MPPVWFFIVGGLIIGLALIFVALLIAEALQSSLGSGGAVIGTVIIMGIIILVLYFGGGTLLKPIINP